MPADTLTWIALGLLAWTAGIVVLVALANAAGRGDAQSAEQARAAVDDLPAPAPAGPSELVAQTCRAPPGGGGRRPGGRAAPRGGRRPPPRGAGRPVRAGGRALPGARRRPRRPARRSVGRASRRDPPPRPPARHASSAARSQPRARC